MRNLKRKRKRKRRSKKLVEAAKPNLLNEGDRKHLNCSPSNATKAL